MSVGAIGLRGCSSGGTRTTDWLTFLRYIKLR
jgi:hypothetical protein